MELYGPHDTWPTHSSTFDGPLQYAKSSKWYLQKFDGHSWGNLICSNDLPYDGRCNILILRTARGSESFALDLRSKIDRCPHRKSRKTRSPLSEANHLLEQAETLVGAARRCIEATAMRARVDELLDLADQAVDEAADLLLEEAQEAEERATAEQEAAEAAADAGGYDGDEPVDTDPLLDEATSRVGMARQRLPRAGGTKRAETRQRAEQVSSAIASLRAQHVETN